MENATKALSIAANILLAVMILSVIMYMYNKIRVHPIEQEQALLIEQAEEFNRQFEVYDKFPQIFELPFHQPIFSKDFYYLANV